MLLYYGFQKSVSSGQLPSRFSPGLFFNFFRRGEGHVSYISKDQVTLINLSVGSIVHVESTALIKFITG